LTIAKPEHEVAYQDLAALLGKHGDSVTALEMLAIAGNLVGKLIALQDQRTVTKKIAIEIVLKNIGIGNRHLIAELEKTVGSA
jgi:hypothetical protein